jgi:hypothetical protein
MILVPISAVPNQSFSITLDGNQYDISLYITTNVMAIDIIRNNIPVIMGIRVLPYVPIIPYEYLENGNFFFNTENGDYPYFEQFNVTQQLFYLSQAELVTVRTTGTL